MENKLDRYTLLHDYIEQNRRTPFQWGTMDCLSFGLNWAQLATGIKTWDDIETYDTEFGAARVLKSRGYDSLNAALDAHFTQRELNFVQRGDLVIGANTASESFTGLIGVHCGDVCAYTGENGLEFFPPDSALHAWKVD